MLNRTGHFWEQRYHSVGFPSSDYRRVLNTLRYIHANPKAAGMQRGFFFDFSNYGSYERLTMDGITEWHPAFMAFGISLSLNKDQNAPKLPADNPPALNTSTIISASLS